MHHAIPDIARHAGLSATKLKQGFKILYGTGIYHYLKEQRLEKGKHLVENTDKTLREISHRLGYKHEASFITAFRKKFGKAPVQWRKRITVVFIFLREVFFG
jgi:AraC-like DNA-binding protein